MILGLERKISRLHPPTTPSPQTTQLSRTTKLPQTTQVPRSTQSPWIYYPPGSKYIILFAIYYDQTY